MIKLFNQSIGRLRLTKTKSLIQASLIVGTLVALLSSAGEALGQTVPASNPFVILLDGFWEPVAAVPGNLGLALPHLSNGKYRQVTIYNLASGFPGPTDEVVGTAYALGGEGVIAYGLRDGALTAKFVGNNLVTTTNADGSTTMTGTYDLNIMEATGIYQSFVGGHIHMVDVMKHNLDGSILEHCFCHISPPLLVTISTSQVAVCWNSESNLTYQVQYRSDLTTNLWTSLVGCVRSTGSTTCLSDPVVLGQPQRFYRVVQTNCVPPPPSLGKVTFTKWITVVSPRPGVYADMVGVIVGGDVGDGTYTGEALTRVVDPVTGVITIEADYHIHGSINSFDAHIIAVQNVAGVGQKGVITGVVTGGWLQGHAVAGEWTVIPPCGYGGGVGIGNCFDIILDILK
ncbi:MAG: hypothetical protein AAB466_05480 [Verrucomicrobiota bacterium]